MQQFVDDLHLLNKVSHMFVPEPLFLNVLLDCDFLAQPLAQEYLSVTAFADRFNDIDLFFGDEEVQLDTFFCHVFLYLGLHVLLWSRLLTLSALLLSSVLFLALFFLFLALTAR
jgi:hypothetical protein